MGALHLGLTPWLISDSADAAMLGRQGQLAESWGYRSFWLPEHHFSRGGAVPEPLMLLAAVAARRGQYFSARPPFCCRCAIRSKLRNR